MSQVIGQVWRKVVGCRNWSVMLVPQFIALRRNAMLDGYECSFSRDAHKLTNWKNNFYTQYTIECRYNAVKYGKLLHKLL